MIKILISTLLLSSFLFGATSALEKAYDKGRSIASTIDKSTAPIVKIQKCKYFVLLEKSISAKMRNEAYRGCEDEIYGKKN